MSKSPRLYTILILLLLVSSLHGQNHKLITGPDFKLNTKKAAWVDIEEIGHDDEYIYYICYSFRKYYSGAYIGSKDDYIARVNRKTLKLEDWKPIIYETNGEEVNFEFVLSNATSSYIFTSLENTRNKTISLYAQKIDRQDLTLSSSVKPFATIKIDDIKGYEKTIFEVTTSANKSKHLISWSLVGEDNQLLRLGMNMMNDQFESIGSSSTIPIPNDGVYHFQYFTISDDAKIGLITKYFADKKDFKNNVTLKRQGFLSGLRSWEEEANYQYKILSFKDVKSQPTTLNVSPDGLFVTAVDIIYKSGNEMILVGFYSDNGDNIPDGLFTQTIKNGTKYKPNRHHFNGSFDQPSKYTNDTYEGKALQSKPDLSKFRFVLKNIIDKNSGGYIFSAERNTTLTQEYRSAQGVGSVNVYHTDDIMVADIAENGTINWTKKIEKKQETDAAANSFLWSEYYISEVNNKIVIFFTDFQRSNISKLGKVSDTETQLVVIEPNGTKKQSTLYTHNEDNKTIKARSVTKLNDGEFILYLHDGKWFVSFSKLSL